VPEDAERLIAAWNERQALRAPMIFRPRSAPPSRRAIHIKSPPSAGIVFDVVISTEWGGRR
jgi:hypothetical protein